MTGEGRVVGGELYNLGDLNKNGTDEIGFYPYLEASAWHHYYVYTFSNGKWIDAVDPIYTYDFEGGTWRGDVIPIEIDKHREGYVIIRSAEFDVDEGAVVKTKSVKIAK
jgi:hypothetical protein